jgi:hypothetical protein
VSVNGCPSLYDSTDSRAITRSAVMGWVIKPRTERLPLAIAPGREGRAW